MLRGVVVKIAGIVCWGFGVVVIGETAIETVDSLVVTGTEGDSVRMSENLRFSRVSVGVV